MKKLTFIFMLFLAVNGYAQESKFKEIDGYGLLSEKGCSYTTQDGKEKVALESTLCVSVYKTDIILELLQSSKVQFVIFTASLYLFPAVLP